MTTETISLGSVDEADAGKVVNEAEEVVNGPEAENERLKAENERLTSENLALKAENERLEASLTEMFSIAHRYEEMIRSSSLGFLDGLKIIVANSQEIDVLKKALGLDKLLKWEKAEPPKNLPNYKIDFDPNDPLWKTRLRELIQGLEKSIAPGEGTESGSGPSNFQHSTPTEQAGNLPT